MSLEKYLEANTKAVNRLADLIEQGKFIMPVVADIDTDDAFYNPAEDSTPVKDRSITEPTASAPVESDTEQDASNDDDNSDEPEAAAATTTDEVATAPVTDEPVDKDAVINAMKACLLRTDKPTVVKILKKYNVSRVSDLDSRDLAGALADFESAVLEDLPF